MFVDCPHCHTRMIPMTDGTCPACQKDTRDTTGLDLSRTSIRVSQGDVLPPVCCECGQRTPHMATICRKTSPDREPSVAAILSSIVPWAKLWLVFREIADISVVQVEMPQCEACATRGLPEPRYVDFGNARMTFVVHKNLKEAITQ